MCHTHTHSHTHKIAYQIASCSFSFGCALGNFSLSHLKCSTHFGWFENRLLKMRLLKSAHTHLPDSLKNPGHTNQYCAVIIVELPIERLYQKHCIRFMSAHFKWVLREMKEIQQQQQQQTLDKSVQTDGRLMHHNWRTIHSEIIGFDNRKLFFHRRCSLARLYFSW